jgi:hypothetical protein
VTPGGGTSALITAEEKSAPSANTVTTLLVWRRPGPDATAMIVRGSVAAESIWNERTPESVMNWLL